MIRVDLGMMFFKFYDFKIIFFSFFMIYHLKTSTSPVSFLFLSTFLND